jgi:hypothetical protein
MAAFGTSLTHRSTWPMSGRGREAAAGGHVLWVWTLVAEKFLGIFGVGELRHRLCGTAAVASLALLLIPIEPSV